MKIKDLKIIVNDLYRFYRTFICSDFVENLPAEHIRKLSVELERLYLGDYKRLCVAMPPRHSKSSLITLAYPLWLIFHNPNLHIFIINNTQTLSEKFGIALREYVKKYGGYFNIYLSDVKHSNSHLMFTDSKGNLYSGSIRLQGAGGSITGQDVDYLILDDPYKGEADEFTPSALQKKIDWFNTIILQRLEPQTRLCILHTRWHSNDIQGYLYEHQRGDYHFINLPAIKDDGTPLWKERYSIEMLEHRKSEMGDRLFEAIYQQNPLDSTSDFFNMDAIIYNKPIDIDLSDKSCRAWDIASSDKTKGKLNDSTAGILMYRLDDYAIITDLVHGQFGTDTKNKIRSTAHRDTPNIKIVIETGVAAAGELLYQEWEEQLTGYRVEQAKPIPSKVDRATPLQNAVLDKKLIINLNDNAREKFNQEFMSFPFGEHDDIVDAAAHAYNYLFRNEESSVGLGMVYL